MHTGYEMEIVTGNEVEGIIVIRNMVVGKQAHFWRVLIATWRGHSNPAFRLKVLGCVLHCFQFFFSFEEIEIKKRHHI